MKSNSHWAMAGRILGLYEWAYETLLWRAIAAVVTVILAGFVLSLIFGAVVIALEVIGYVLGGIFRMDWQMVCGGGDTGV